MKQCKICEKKSRLVWRRVKLRANRYNPTIKRRQYPNLQWIRIPFEIKKPIFKKWVGKRVLICAKCIKTLGKRK